MVTEVLLADHFLTGLNHLANKGFMISVYSQVVALYRNLD